jgi:hypothetical protein
MKIDWSDRIDVISPDRLRDSWQAMRSKNREERLSQAPLKEKEESIRWGRRHRGFVENHWSPTTVLEGARGGYTLVNLTF